VRLACRKLLRLAGRSAASGLLFQL
jgi:hypothetical protein